MSKKHKMLIVDNIETDRTILGYIFEKEYIILEASNGYAAKEIIEKNVDTVIIILNIILPMKDGLEFLKFLKSIEELKDIPVVISMEYKDVEYENKALELGASDFILKPYRPAIITNRIRGIVERFLFEKRNMEELLKKTLRELRYRAERDFLTGIYNTETFCSKTKEMLEANREDYVLIVWNVKRFKIINDMIGQEKGNKILKQLAKRFHDALIGKGTFGRLEADHFVSCYPEEFLDIPSLLNQIEKEKGTYDTTYNIFINFGIYHIIDRTIPVSNMCDRAILALQTVRENYLNHHAIYNESLRNKLLEEQQLSAEVEKAIYEEQFCVFLQPIYSVTDKMMVSAEALVRWKHPEKGLISPDQFVPLFEKNGLITKIDMFVLEAVCRFQKKLMEEQINGVSISVNLSRINFYNPNLSTIISDLVNKYNIPTSMIRFEITESVYTDNKKQLLNTMKRLQNKGFKILMDDFGSGYSSLNMLKDVPVDILKIDMNFINNLETSKRAGNIVTSVIRMAKWLNMKVIAEGVETKAQLDFLRSIGCDNIQGYYFSKPLPTDIFQLLLCNKETILEKESPKDILSLYELDGVWESDKKMELIFNEMLGGMGIYELSGHTLEIVRANTGYFEIMKDTMEISKNVLEHVHEEDRELLLRKCYKAQETQKVEEVVVRRRLTQGELIWLNIKIRFLAKTGKRALLYFTFNNITTQKEYEKNLYLNQYNMVLGGIYDEIYEMNYTDDICTMIKGGINSFYDFLKKTPLEEATKEYVKNIYEEDRAFYYNTFVNDIEKNFIEKDRFTFETRIRKKDEKYHWVEVVVFRFADPMGKKIYLICNRDIEEQKKAEKQDLQQLLDNIPVGIGIYQLGDTIQVQYCNERVYQMFQMDKEEVKTTDIRKYIFFEEDKLVKMRQQPGMEKTYSDHVFLCKKSDGSDMWIRTFSTIMPKIKGKQICYAVLTDVTEQVQMGRDINFKDNLELKKNKKRILVVDDIKLNRVVIEETLADKYEIVEAENGREALNLLLSEKINFDLVVSDIMMPIMDGFELLFEMHKDFKLMKIPVVVVTAMNDTENELKAFNMGAIDVIHKPFDADVLKQRISNLLKLAEMERIQTENYMLQKHQEVKNQLEAILEGTPGGIYRIQLRDYEKEIRLEQSKMIYANETFFEIRNIKREKEGNTERAGYIYDKYISEDIQTGILRLKSAIQEKERFFECDMRIPLLDGGVKYILCNNAISYEKDMILLDVMETDVSGQKAAEEKLRENNIFLDIIKNVVLPNTKVGLWRYDILRRQMVEVPHNVQGLILNNTLENIGKIILEKKYIHRKSWNKIKEMFEKIERGESIVEETFVVNNKNGNENFYMWFHVTYTTIFDEKGMPISAVGISEDISEQIENEIKYKKEKQYKEINWNESLAFAEINLSQNTVEQEETKMFGINQKLSSNSYTELIEACGKWMVKEEYQGLFLENLNLSKLLKSYEKGIKEVQFDFKVMLQGENKYTWVTSVTQLICDDLSHDIYANWQVKNIEERQRKALEWGEAAKKDPLTKLYNRYEIERTVNEVLQKNIDEKTYAALIMIDLDNFKMINDTFGHEYGDEVLIKVANILKSIFRLEDYVGRIGGDEFVVFLPAIPDRNATEKRLETVCKRLNMKFVDENKSVQISCSVGIAFAPPCGGDFKALYNNADEAQYRAKKVERIST
ncbi:MAG: EAL domain-containing protein [Acetivibrio sp.]